LLAPVGQRQPAIRELAHQHSRWLFPGKIDDGLNAGVEDGAVVAAVAGAAEAEVVREFDAL